MSLTVIKTGAIAAAILLATTAASFASTWATVDHDASVRMFHSNGSVTVNFVAEDDQVKVIDQWGNWYKIKIPGQDGWVKANALDFGGWNQNPGPSPVQACFWGPVGYVCINP